MGLTVPMVSGIIIIIIKRKKEEEKNHTGGLKTHQTCFQTLGFVASEKEKQNKTKNKKNLTRSSKTRLICFSSPGVGGNEKIKTKNKEIYLKKTLLGAQKHV